MTTLLRAFTMVIGLLIGISAVSAATVDEEGFASGAFSDQSAPSSALTGNSAVSAATVNEEGFASGASNGQSAPSSTTVLASLQEPEDSDEFWSEMSEGS